MSFRQRVVTYSTNRSSDVANPARFSGRRNATGTFAWRISTSVCDSSTTVNVVDVVDVVDVVSVAMPCLFSSAVAWASFCAPSHLSRSCSAVASVLESFILAASAALRS